MHAATTDTRLALETDAVRRHAVHLRTHGYCSGTISNMVGGTDL